MMKDSDHPRIEQDMDWNLTTWEGARREQMRRWAQLPLEDAIKALEEMEKVFGALQPKLAECSPGSDE